MFWRILKKDLKRKKTMNVILLLFVIICSMLAAASVNNIMAVTGGVDRFIEMSDAPDLVFDISGSNEFADELEDMPSVDSVTVQHSVYIMPDHLVLGGKKMDKIMSGTVGSFSDAEFGAKYFDADNKEIESVPKGSFYCTKNFLYEMTAEPGDILEIFLGGEKRTLRYEGLFKTCVHNTDNSSTPNIMLNSTDWEDLNTLAGNKTFRSVYAYVKTSDPAAVKQAAEGYIGVSYSTKNDFSENFIYDKLTAYILLAVCSILVITAFAALRFAIGFTISEEFREIGVMKAVGIDNRSIRGLYVTKYAAIAVTGSVIGYAASIPFGELLIKSISKNIVFDGTSALLGLAGSGAVVAAILLFCYICTRGIKKLSPIDAVRSGQTGERYGKKSVMHLGRSKLPATGFLAMNDVMSAPKQFVIITIVFTLCVLLMTIMSSCADTLSSSKPIRMFAIPESTHASIMDTKGFDLSELASDENGWKNIVEKEEKLLADNGIPGKCTMTMGTECATTCGDKTENLCYLVTKNISAEAFPYDEGTAPMKTDECAMTEYALKALGAQIGDRVKMTIMGEEREYIITGTFSSFIKNGMCARLCEEDTTDVTHLNNMMGLQIRFDGDPDDKQITAKIDKLKDVTGLRKIFTNAELVDNFTEMSSTLDGIKKIMMLVTVIVTSLIVILMERSFVSKEKSEIALMKAVGLKGGSIIGQHVLRFIIAALIAVGIASAAVLPVSRMLMNMIFSLIGSCKGIGIAYNAAEIFGICPAILITVAAAGTFLTSLCTKGIKAADTASIE